MRNDRWLNQKSYPRMTNASYARSWTNGNRNVRSRTQSRTRKDQGRNRWYDRDNKEQESED